MRRLTCPAIAMIVESEVAEAWVDHHPSAKIIHGGGGTL
jgi:hypothetical protein